MNTYMEPREMIWMDNDIGYQCVLCWTIGGPWNHGDPPTCEHKHNHGMSHNVWTYSIYLGPYKDETGKLWDLGVCTVGASPSLAMVYGPNASEYISGPLPIELSKHRVERETQRRWVAYKFHGKPRPGTYAALVDMLYCERTSTPVDVLLVEEDSYAIMLPGFPFGSDHSQEGSNHALVTALALERQGLVSAIDVDIDPVSSDVYRRWELTAKGREVARNLQASLNKSIGGEV